MAEIVDLTERHSVNSTDSHSESSSQSFSQSSSADELEKLLNKYVPSSPSNRNFEGCGNNIGTQNSTDSTPEFEYPIYDMHRFVPAYIKTNYNEIEDSVWVDTLPKEHSFRVNSSYSTLATDGSCHDYNYGAQAPNSLQPVHYFM